MVLKHEIKGTRQRNKLFPKRFFFDVCSVLRPLSFVLAPASFIFFVFCFFLNPNAGFSQSRPPAGVGGNSENANNPTNLVDSTQDEAATIDTAYITSFFPMNRGVITLENDSLLTRNFQQYDPTRQRDNDYAHLGQTATAAHEILYEPIVHRGFDIGIHAFDIYHIKNDALRFYNQTKPFADLFFSGTQENGVFNARFGRTFSDNIGLSVDYRRDFNLNLTNQPSVRGRLYDIPRARTVAFAIGLWIKKERYDGFLTFTSNFATQTDKGGIASDTIFNTVPNNSFTTADARLTNTALSLTAAGGVSRIERYEIAYRHFFNLNKSDSTGTKRQYRVEHNIAYKSDKYFSANKFPSDSTNYFNNYNFYDTAFIKDLRGVRYYVAENVISNDFRVGTVRERITRDSSGKKILKQAQSDLFEVGISHEYHSIDQEIVSRKAQNIIGVGRWLYTPSDNFRVDANAFINFIGYNAGDYRLAGEIFYNLPKIGTLSVRAINQLYAPSFLQSELYVTDSLVWKNNFSKTLETHLNAALAVPTFDFSVSVGYTLLNNFIYFDTNALAQQAAVPISILSAVIQKNFKVGVFHLDNTITLQQSSEKFIPVPALYTKHSLYFEKKIFKKVMLFRSGFDVRYISSWFAPAYMPLTAQFFIQDKLSVPAVPVIDFYLSLKVKTFRFFLKSENIAGDITGKVYYPSYLYPTTGVSTKGATYYPFRFGIRWQLLN